MIEKKTCLNCNVQELPCVNCGDYDNWEPVKKQRKFDYKKCIEEIEKISDNYNISINDKDLIGVDIVIEIINKHIKEI